MNGTLQFLPTLNLKFLKVKIIIIHIYFTVVYMYCNLVYLNRYLFSQFTSDFKITVSFILCYVTEAEVIARTSHRAENSRVDKSAEDSLLHIDLYRGMKYCLPYYLHMYIVVVGDSIYISVE